MSSETLDVNAMPGSIAAVTRTRISLTGGPVSPVAAALVSMLAPATHVVHEWTIYTLMCPGAGVIEVGATQAERIVEGVFRVRFENQLGLARLRARGASGRVIATCHVEVISAKLGGHLQSLAFLRAMLADLSAERGALAFLPRAQTARTVRTVAKPPSLLVRYLLLLRHADDLIAATRLVERNPHRVLDDERQHVSLVDLTEIDPDVVLQLVQGDSAWDRSTSPPRLRAAPAGVWFRAATESFDSAENRFVRAVALQLADACTAVLRVSWLQALDDPVVAPRREVLNRLRARLAQFARTPMFDQVGPMHRVPAASRVLQRRSGYRELNLVWQAFLTAREPVWQRMQEAIDLRDVATLYEYWVWFALCREIEAATGEHPDVRVTATDDGLAHGLTARFGHRGRLTYNASRRGYSGISLRPDYLWEPEHGAKVAFDAKFRLAWDMAPLDVEGGETDPVARAKADDLVKMHAYRDAISGVRAAVVLYPGHVAAFRTVSGAQVADVTVAEVLNGEIEGVGAIPMRPEGIEG